METALCGECRDFLQSYHSTSVAESYNEERSIAIILDAINSGCRLCQAIVTRLKSVLPDLLPLAKANSERATFYMFPEPYGNSNMNSPEDWQRIFFDVSILNQRSGSGCGL